MSGELLPAVHHLAEQGLTAAARAVVKGNRIKTEVVLYAARAHELPESWLGERMVAAASTVGGAVASASDAGASAGSPAPGLPGGAAPAFTAAPEQPRAHVPIPPQPTGIRFTVPPEWPSPPAGWVPPPGWRPDPSWKPAPEGWQWWVPVWE